MLANNRIAKLKGLDKNEISSIGTSKNANHKGASLGKNNANKFIPCFLIPIKTTAKNVKNESRQVTTIWLANVKLCGNNPKMLKVKINKNKQKMSGKNFCPSFPKLVISKEKMKL